MQKTLYEPAVLERMRDRIHRFELSELRRRRIRKRAASATFASATKKSERAKAKSHERR